MRADGSNEETLVTADRAAAQYLVDPDWSPNGEKIVFTAADDGGYSTIMVVRVDGTELMPLRELARNPAFSPDGKKIVFNSIPLGEDHCIPPNLYSMKVDGSESTLLVRYPYRSDCSHDDPSPSWQPLP
jgi:Tol biopolymer transport system component